MIEVKSDCSKCTHESVCRFTEQTKSTINFATHEFDDNNMVEVTIKCHHYDFNLPVVRR